MGTKSILKISVKLGILQECQTGCLPDASGPITCSIRRIAIFSVPYITKSTKTLKKLLLMNEGEKRRIKQSHNPSI